MILTPLPQAGAVHPVPFQEVAGYVSVSWDEAVVQIGGNLAVFAAFGALAPVRWRIGLATVAALAAAGSITVETLQYALDLGRVSSVDDVLLNTAGAVLAALVTRRWWRRVHPPAAISVTPVDLVQDPGTHRAQPRRSQLVIHCRIGCLPPPQLQDRERRSTFPTRQRVRVQDRYCAA